LAKKKITTHVVSAGRLQDDGTGYECNPKTQLQQVALNSGTQLLESTDLSELKQNLRMVFESIGGEPSSGSAASVISNSRSGEGAIFQAVFFPTQEDQLGNKITWAGDVHALWLDERGNIREDCGATSCGAGDQDAHLDRTLDHILQFYTDPISSSARARVFNDADGDGRYDPATDQLEDNISLRDIRYVWSAGEWLAQVAENVVETQRSYGGTGKQRYIVTSLDGASMIAFTPAAVSAGLGSTAYKGYFHAATVDEANDIISYIRGDDTRFFPDGVTPRGYRSRSIDWDENGTPEIWKLGDVVNSTPTVVSTPAEDYDLIYGDYSYLTFRKRYRNRRSMVYAGGNDGGFHAFNGGFYNRATNTIDKAPPPDTDGATKVAYDLGAEMWMFVPRNLFPHLKWLTDPKYSHVNYVDFKPYIFDAKIFPPDVDHPAGWGTILVGGLGFGGGDIGVDTDGDGVDDLTLRSQYFILDITNPEVPPKILGEFTHPNLGFTIGAPTAVPLLLCELKVDCPATSTAWPMDWYLAFPSGPYHDTEVQVALNGMSNQLARIFTVPLGGTGGLALANVTAPVGSTYTSFTVDDTTNFPNSFFSDVIAVDYDLNFKTDTLYFGSVAKASGDDPSLHTGGMHRLVIGEAADTLSNPWGLHTFFKTPGNQPVSGSPSVSYDGQRAWVFFGTGRYYSAQMDKANHAQQSYYGLKEQYDAAGVMQLTQMSGANLIDVSDVWVEDGGDLHLTTGTLPLKAYNYSNSPVTSADLPAEVTTFAKLDKEMSMQDNLDLDKYNGWKLDFDQPGERNLGQAAILGNIVTFTTFVPSEDICQPEGESFLWAPYYRTGTAYMRNVIGTVARDGETEVLRKLSVGAGLASTPNIHTGAEAGSTAFVQTSTGAIISVQQNNPGVIKGGPISWRELGD
jgi:type IV pilus assembly protein PilY1